MTSPDPVEAAKPWLQMCAPCDLGLPTRCTCPSGDFRSIILALVNEVERLRWEKK